MAGGGSVCIVFGGSRGIGRAVCQHMAKIGYSVVCASRHKEQCEQVVESLPQQTEGETRHLPVQCDVSDEESVVAACRFIVDRAKRADVLVNAAGVNKDSLLMRLKSEDIRYHLDTNLVGTMLTCRGLLPLMLKHRQGAVINIGSVVGSTGNVGQSAYSASKAGLIGFTRSLAKEVGSRGVRANVLAPGFIETDMTAGISTDAQKRLIASVPVQRFGTVEETAHAVEFLAAATYITGQVLIVDGGLSVVTGI